METIDNSSSSSVIQFLSCCGYSHFAPIFQQNEILTITALIDFEEDELTNLLNCPKLVAKQLLLKAKNWNDNNNDNNNTNKNNGNLSIVSAPLTLYIHKDKLESERIKYDNEKKIRDEQHALRLQKLDDQCKLSTLSSSFEHSTKINELKLKLLETQRKGQIDLMNTKVTETEKTQSLTNPLPWAASLTSPPPFLTDSFSFPVGSSLLTPPIHNTIQGWLGSPRLWTLLYRGTRDTFSASVFHNHCNNMGATITLVRVNNYLFGGYNPYSWSSTLSDSYLSGSMSFLFSLVNPYGDGFTKFPFKGSGNGPYDSFTYLPTFGGGHDLCIANNCHSNTQSYSNFPYDYVDTIGRGNTTFTGSKNFTVSEIEVFKVY